MKYDDPVVKVLALLGVVLRVIGNIDKFFKIMGGKTMNIIMKNTIVKKLANVAETLLVVGNLGDVHISPLAVKDRVDSPTRTHIL